MALIFRPTNKRHLAKVRAPHREVSCLKGQHTRPLVQFFKVVYAPCKLPDMLMRRRLNAHVHAQTHTHATSTHLRTLFQGQWDYSDGGLPFQWEEELGGAGVLFITKLMETQMFSHFCYSDTALSHSALHRGKIWRPKPRCGLESTCCMQHSFPHMSKQNFIY